MHKPRQLMTTKTALPKQYSTQKKRKDRLNPKSTAESVSRQNEKKQKQSRKEPSCPIE